MIYRSWFILMLSCKTLPKLRSCPIFVSCLLKRPHICWNILVKLSFHPHISKLTRRHHINSSKRQYISTHRHILSTSTTMPTHWQQKSRSGLEHQHMRILWSHDFRSFDAIRMFLYWETSYDTHFVFQTNKQTLHNASIRHSAINTIESRLNCVGKSIFRLISSFIPPIPNVASL